MLKDATPLLWILTLSVTPVAPSAAVLNESLPGISLTPGVPSQEADISAAAFPKSPPSAPANLILPNSSPSLTIVLPARVAFLDFAKPIDGPLALLLYLIKDADDLSKSVPDICNLAFKPFMLVSALCPR